MATEDGRQSTTRLSLTGVPGMPERLNRFFPLLQQGFCVRAQLGCSIRELLCGQFGIEPDYLKQRITTIFLNSKAIDDPDTSLVGNGATLALSAAMPGLVGATMRRGGYYAAMRGALTHHETFVDAGEKYGSIRIKLFNLLMAELGPGFLRMGIIVPPGDLAAFLAEQSPDFWAGWKDIQLNGKPVAAAALQAGAGIAAGEDPVELSVLFEE